MEMTRRTFALLGVVGAVGGVGALAACSSASDPSGAGSSTSAGASSTSTGASSTTSTTTATQTTDPSGTTSTTTDSPTTAAPATAGPATGTATVVRTLATGIDVPWGLARLPSGELLVSARDSYQITRLDPTAGTSVLVGTVGGVVSNVSQSGEAGLLGLAVSPSFATDGLVYAYASTASDNRVVTMIYDASKPAGQQLGAPRAILTGIPHGIHHNGGRLGFGPDGYLYVTTGESGVPALAQDKGSLGGKILRVTTAGQSAPGNPFGTRVWTYGHRNVQGIAWDTAGRLWASEFGDKTADELNLITAGADYGWPATQGRTTVAGYTSPVAQWGTDEDSPSGIAYAGGCVWMAALKGQRLWRIPLDGTTVVASPTSFLDEAYGRLRSVLALDDRTLLLTTSNRDGRQPPGTGDDKVLLVSVT